MTPEEKDAIRSRNRKRRARYGESQQAADGEMWTVGGEDDVDALLAEVERLEAKQNACPFCRPGVASAAFVRNLADLQASVCDCGHARETHNHCRRCDHDHCDGFRPRT